MQNDERGERTMNKKPINRNSIFIRTLSKMRAYCSMFYKFSTFSILDADFFCVWCVKCVKYLAFDTFERPDDSALKNLKSFA